MLIISPFNIKVINKGSICYKNETFRFWRRLNRITAGICSSSLYSASALTLTQVYCWKIYFNTSVVYSRLLSCQQVYWNLTPQKLCEANNTRLVQDFGYFPAILWNGAYSSFFLKCFVCVIVNRDLQLKQPIYQRTACYGHFGRNDFTWEIPKPLKWSAIDQEVQLLWCNWNIIITIEAYICYYENCAVVIIPLLRHHK